jgi:hypothetical protein
VRRAALEAASRALEVQRGLHVRPRKVAVEGAVGTAVPGVAYAQINPLTRRDNLIYAPRVTSINIVKGRFERRVELQAA